MGVLVAVDGIDGSGITTLAEMLVEKLKEKSRQALYSKEPGIGTFAGDLIYHYVRGRFGGKSRPGKNPELETLLFAIDRYYQGLVEPGWVKRLRDNNLFIVKDRYYYTSMVYQSYGFLRQGLRREKLDRVLTWIRSVNAWMPPAHLVVYLVVDPEVAAARLAQNMVRTTLNLYPLEELGELSRHAEWFYREWLRGHPESGEDSDWYPHLWELHHELTMLYKRRYPIVCIAREDDKLAPHDALKPLLEPLLNVLLEIEVLVQGGGDGAPRLPSGDRLACIEPG